MRPDKAKRQKRQAIVLGVLMVVLAGLAVRHYMPQPRQSAAAVNRPAAAKAAGDATAASTQKLTPVALTWPLAVEGDPFGPNGVYPRKPEPQPVTAKQTPQPKVDPAITAAQVQEQANKSLKLQGMILGAVPRAVVNNRPVAAGEEVDGFRIVTIEPRRIVVHKSGFDVELELK